MKRKTIIAVILGLLLLLIWHGCRSTLASMMGLAGFSARNNAAISFYGRVVDQDGKPLKGVEVSHHVSAIPLIPVPWSADHVSEGSCVTDEKGLFAVEGMRGVSFGIRGLRKTGYRETGYYSQGHVRYEPLDPQRHIPDRVRPVEFMLVGDDLPEAGKVFEKSFPFSWSEEPISMDLGPNLGKLILTAKRQGYNPSNLDNPFDWSVAMRFDAFDAIPVAENSCVAPKDGYKPDIAFDFPKDRTNWRYRLSDSRFAIYSRDGKYGVMEIRIHADGEVVSNCWITIYLNPSGARNLDHK